MRRLPVLLALLGLAACGDPASRAEGPKVEGLVAVPVLRPTTVVPLDPAGARPRIQLPEVKSEVRTVLQIDDFLQREATVDILWVVDDSGSMASERQRLVASYDRFIAALLAENERIKYRVGVTSTTVGPGSQNGRLRGRFIDETTADPRGAFASQLDFPESRARLEQGLEAARLALGGVNPGFLRPEAALAVIFVSDEDDASYPTTAWYARVLRGLKGAGNENLVTLSAIGGPVPDGCIPPGQEDILWADAKPAIRYRELVDLTEGAFGSICEDFAPTIERIVQSVRTMRRVFPLSLEADLDTLQVLVCPDADSCGDDRRVEEDPVNGWQYDEELRAVTFRGDYVPPPRWLVRLQYALRGGTP